MRICFVQLRCHSREIVTILNEFNQSLERKKSLPWLVYVLKKNFPLGQEILCLFNSCAAKAKKSDRKACSACRVMFCLLKPIAYLLLCLPSLKWNQSNGYKLPFYGLLYYDLINKVQCYGKSPAIYLTWTLLEVFIIFFVYSTHWKCFLKCDLKVERFSFQFMKLINY